MDRKQALVDPKPPDITKQGAPVRKKSTLKRLAEFIARWWWLLLIIAFIIFAYFPVLWKTIALFISKLGGIKMIAAVVLGASILADGAATGADIGEAIGGLIGGGIGGILDGVTSGLGRWWWLLPVGVAFWLLSRDDEVGPDESAVLNEGDAAVAARPMVLAAPAREPEVRDAFV